MRNHRMNRLGLLAIALLVFGACDLDLQDPNLPTEADVLGSVQGVTAVAIGLQADYSNHFENLVFVTGLVTDEVGAGAATFQVYQDVDAGNVDGRDNALSPTLGPWSGMYSVVKLANDLIREAPNVGFGSATLSGILALAELYKGVAFGNIAQIYEDAPIDVGPQVEAPTFLSSDEVLAEAISLLESARDRIAATPPSDEFNNNILAPGLDLENTIQAMLARFALIAGDYATANTAAAAVDLTVLSELRFSATDQNPIYDMWYGSGNAYQMRPEDSWRLAADGGDQRVDYWTTVADITGAVVPLDELNHYNTPDDPYPFYLPDEMKLIRAEVAARNNDLATALTLLNEVRTQCPADVVVDEPAACLAALPAAAVSDQASMLAAIHYERQYELYLQCVSWSDQRRFGTTLKYDWMLTPQTECERNANAINCTL